MKDLVGNGFAAATLTKYKTTLAYTQEFILFKYKIADIEIQKLNFEFMLDFEFWLKKVKSCAHNTVMKYLTNFKKIVMICVKNGWLT